MTKKPLLLLAIGVLTAATAAGCGSGSTASPSPSSAAAPIQTTSVTSATSQTPSPSSTAPRVLQKNLGDWAGTGDQCAGTPQSCELSFRITKLTNCTGRYAGDPPPEGTERKLVWVEVVTGPQYDVTELYSGLVTQFTAINGAGVTSGNINPSTTWRCAPEGQRMGFGDENWLPGKKYAGAIEVYLPKDAVKIANGDGMWEWSIGR
ncbi:hypothetical protein [Kibdelosporangium aridum]|uniref:hypothetical protein n=1 Tax=Kibdelosporangium aridum TaxID=2030 RepID=UPI0035E85446